MYQSAAFDTNGTATVSGAFVRAKSRDAARIGACATFLFLVPLCANAEVICALGTGAPSYKAAEDQRPTPDAMQAAKVVNSAMKKICGDHCPEAALFRNPTAPNIMFVFDAGQAKLVYSPKFFSDVYSTLGDDAIVAVLAHELGHALDDTMGAAWVKSNWTPELRADAWAGCALGKLGLSAASLDSSLKALAKYPSPAHPAWATRLPVLRIGYTQCGGDAAKFDKRK